MSADVRIPGDEHREEIARCLSRSMNFPLERALRRAPQLPLEDFRCAFEDGRVVATAAEHHFVQWFRGRSMEMSGIWAVSTLPEHRETGLASAGVRELLEGARGRGVPVSMLFPAVIRPYRRLGYELAGTFTDHRVPLAALPASPDDLPRVEVADISRDLDGVRSCYHDWVQHHHATLEPTDDRWWTERIFDDGGEESFGAVVVRDGDDVTGFATFKRANDPGLPDVRFGLECSSFVAADARAVHALLAYFRGFRGLGHSIVFSGPPAEPVAMLVEEQKVLPSWTFRWMLRLLDVPSALEARGYPAVAGEATITIDDPMFPENRGSWRLEADGGKVRVSRVDGGESPPMHIGALSAIYTGHLQPMDAVRIGWLEDDDPAVPLLSVLFAGPAPFAYDFF